MTETTFKVGDKVTHADYGAVELVFGPADFPSTAGMWVGRKSDGDHALMAPTAFRPMFEVGDTVAYEYGGGGKLVAGPFKSRYHDEAIWVVENADGTCMTPTQNTLTRVPALAPEPIKVGDRVRVIRAAYVSHITGRTGTVTSVSEEWDSSSTYNDSDIHRYKVKLDGEGGSAFVAELEKVTTLADTYTYDGVVYDLDAKYRDTDGDVWQFVRFGSGVEGGMNGLPDHEGGGDPLEYIVRNYGPLTRVTD